ncbi:MAG: hypothetical protein JWP13_172 [Candidatus Saccharibacteria bacterium]|nr:hypothetical protein [Candidatus Saccharibacteria bacterium]
MRRAKMRHWLSKGSTQGKIGIAVMAVFVVFAVIVSRPQSVQLDTKVQNTSSAKQVTTDTVDVSEKSKIAVTQTEVVTSEEEVPFTTMQTYDGTLLKDTAVVRVEGRAGKKVVRTEVKTKDGVEIGRALISEEVIVQPVTKVVAVGTKMVSSSKKDARAECDPNYKQCVPKLRRALDIDCDDLGFRVDIIGEDVYNLDEDDADGIGCERFSAINP